MCVGSYSLILSVYQDPKSNLVLWVVKVLCDSLLEGAICFVLENTERWKVRCRPVPLVERCQIETFVLVEGVVSDNLGRG